MKQLCLLFSVFFSIGFSLRIMTFNTWFSGIMVKDGQQKIVKHIKTLDPDIVVFQELFDTTTIAMMLGKPWSAHDKAAIITKHEITNHAITNTYRVGGATVRLDDGHEIVVFNVHLKEGNYGPYAPFKARYTNLSQILDLETARVEQVASMIAERAFRAAIADSDDVPVIVAGDFNTVSDLDWTEENRDIHNGWVIPWPVTKMLREEAGLIDSFREIHPDPVKDPGFTWSTVCKGKSVYDEDEIEETNDRVDFIMYRGPLRPTKSFTYSGSQPLRNFPNHELNDYPSDHFALVTEFQFLAPLKKNSSSEVRRLLSPAVNDYRSKTDTGNDAPEERERLDLSGILAVRT